MRHDQYKPVLWGQVERHKKVHDQCLRIWKTGEQRDLERAACVQDEDLEE